MVTRDRPTGEPVRIVCAADAGFVIPLCVMLVSMLIHLDRNRAVEILIFASKIPEEDRRKIEQSLKAVRPGFDPACLRWLAPDADFVRGLPVTEHINLETYSRLLTPFAWPEAERALYLDCDMVVVADVSELYDLPCENTVLGAARDMDIGFVSGPGGVFNYSEMGIPATNPYFNGGVLLMNLKKWREEKVTDRVVAYLRANHDLVQDLDQGGLNAVISDSWKEVDPVWNQTRAIYRPGHWIQSGSSIAAWRRVKNRPKIIHYTGRYKPWKPNLRQPGYSYFFKYLQKTGYRNQIKGPTLEHLIGPRLYSFLWLARRKSFPIFNGR